MKELKYLNILYISNNFTQDIAINYLNMSAKEFYISYNLDEASDILNDKKIDIIFSEYNITEYFKDIRNKNKKVQIIIATDLIEDSHLINGIHLELVKYLQIPITREDLIFSLKDCVHLHDSNKSNILDLKNNYVYDYYNQVLLKDEKIVLLSKKENDFFKLMIKKMNNTVSYEEIDKSIWEGSMTQDALRSVVKELRKKTYKELIKNISGIGYRFNLI
ncbi:winged helix-turn-helix domain-containing protein [Poseidonibacter antarcticus]|uniref:winged helix-turn-helix domain-containing protein n=1 Tax=Poseidonibacter antarcticus TaxID=2478538 RepID=UPI000EF54CE8|nr:winged helix-turn-helix domain-containing protein [Poseidonibacter antarcticus]